MKLPITITVFENYDHYIVLSSVTTTLNSIHSLRGRGSKRVRIGHWSIQTKTMVHFRMKSMPETGQGSRPPLSTLAVI